MGTIKVVPSVSSVNKLPTYIKQEPPMPQSIGGSFIYRVRPLIIIRLNLLQINHQVQILINVNGPVVTVKVPVIAPFHNTPARSRCNIQLHAVLIVCCLHAPRYGTSLLRLANSPDVICGITLHDGLVTQKYRFPVSHPCVTSQPFLGKHNVLCQKKDNLMMFYVIMMSI